MPKPICAGSVPEIFRLTELSAEWRRAFNETLQSTGDSAPARCGAADALGLVPHWINDQAIDNKMINARPETVAERPAFRAIPDCGRLRKGKPAGWII